jgi:alpha-1,6-mannosyltransferase
VLRIFPALVGLPFLALRFRADRRDPLAWLFGGLSAVYVVGYVTARYTLGRELPYVMVCFDVALAIGIAEYLSRRRDPSPTLRWLARVPARGIVAICLIPVVLLGSTAVVGVLTTGETHADVERLAKLTGQYDVVLADQASYPAVPTWGGKLVAWNGALAFIPDIVERRSQAAAFFDPSETLAQRLALLRQYSVRWVLYDRGGAASTAAFDESISQWGTPYATSPDGAFVLIQVGR